MELFQEDLLVQPGKGGQVIAGLAERGVEGVGHGGCVAGAFGNKGPKAAAR
jgi:hypothetical protein